MWDRRHPDKIVAFVMAGGEGKRLRPLTKERCKPGVPFGSRYRIVDFVLSNLINSRIRSIYLLVQYKPQALIEHIRKAWVVSPLIPDHFVTVVPPELMEEGCIYKGTSDAVFQSLRLIELHRPTLVGVFGADHVYRMDVQQMVWFHRDRNADVTVAAIPVPLDQASSFGVIDTDENCRIKRFQEKPEHPQPMPDNPEYAYASMGNYIFRTEVLVNALVRANKEGKTDFGKDVLPSLLKDHRLYAYDFSTNEIPGVKPYEEAGYWRDIGSVDAYYAAHMDALGEQPRFDTFNPQWPIFSSNYQGPVAKILGGEIENSAFGAACLIHKKTRIHNCIIRREAVVEEGAELQDCIIMDYTHIGRGARLRRVIVDRHNKIEAGSEIGFNRNRDEEQYYITPQGVVVLQRGPSQFYARDSRMSGFGYAE